MRLYILDTNVISDFQDGVANVVKNLNSCEAGEVAVTVIAVIERLNGWYSVIGEASTPEVLARRYKNLAMTASLLGSFQILDFTVTAIERFEKLKAMRLPGLRHKKEMNDLRMAAIAMEHDAVFVTNNASHFQVIPQFISIEDWRSYPPKVYPPTH